MIQIKDAANGNVVLYDINGFTFTESDMGNSSINLNLSVPIIKAIVDGQEVDTNAPQFSKQWYVEYKGEKLYLNTNKPQGLKDNTKITYEYTLTFISERDDLMKRMVRNLATLGIDTYISQGQIFTLYANLEIFGQLVQNNLTACFGTKWAIDINPDVVAASKFVTLSISNTYIWDLLLKIYELYGVRWRIVPNETGYAIKVGYEADTITHIFEYGSQDGLTKITRDAASSKIINRLRGTGGTRNMPVNYFTDRYTEYAPDPNPIDGMFVLKNLMPKCFRDSVIAGTGLIDYVEDAELISQNGLVEDGLEANEDIYPSIVGEDGDPNRMDEIVYAEQVLFDDPDVVGEEIVPAIVSSTNRPTTVLGRGASSYTSTGANPDVAETDNFTISGTKDISATVNIIYKDILGKAMLPPYTWAADDGSTVNMTGTVTMLYAKAELVKVSDNSVFGYFEFNKEDANTEKQIKWSDVPSGTYKIRLTTQSAGSLSYKYSYYQVTPGRASRGDRRWIGEHPSYTNYVTVNNVAFSAIANIYNIQGAVGTYKPTFDVWVKDWGFDLNERNQDGTLKYAGTEDAVISFNTGLLAGYEFKIKKDGNGFACVQDTTKSIHGVQSKWKLTLIKSDEEYKDGGLMLPNTAMQAAAGDLFVILNIQMPWSFVTSAEQRLQNYLTDQLAKLKVEYPSYTIEIFDQFIHNNPDIESLLRAGNIIRIFDERLVGGQANLYINTLTVDHKSLLPKYTVTITNKVTVNGSTVQRIQAQIDTISTGQYTQAQTSAENILQLDNRFLRKDAEDSAAYPIEFKKGLTATKIESDDFRRGQFAGAGGAMYKDESGATVVETDKLIVRKEVVFNEMVISQIKFQGGIVVYSCANMEISNVVSGNDRHTLYFDMKGGISQNQFAVGDVIRCQRFISGVVNKYYMSVVVETGTDYIKIYDSTNATNYDGAGVPETGDVVVQFGNISDANRRSAVEIDVLNGGKQTFYQELGSDPLHPFDLTDKNAVEIGVVDVGGVFKNMIRVYGDAYIGERNANSYVKYDSATQEVEVKGKMSFLSGNTVESAITDVAAKVNYKVEILSSNGSAFRNDLINTTLTAKVYKGNEDITSTLNQAAFRWVRKSNNSTSDATWNAIHATFYSNVLDVTSDDVDGRAVFNCEVTI